MSTPDGTAQTTRSTFSRTTRVATTIDAEPSRVWSLLTDADSYPRWSSTVVSLNGPIAPGETVKLVSTLAPGRTFTLKVKEFDSPVRLVWGDAMGKRTFALSPAGPGRTRFEMSERIGGPLFPLFANKIPDFDDTFTRFARDLKAAAETAH